MIKLNYDILELAEMELIREGKQKSKNAGILLLKRAEIISKWFDSSEQHKKIAIAKWHKKKRKV